MAEYVIVRFTMNFMLSSLFLGLVLWYPVDMSKEVDVDVGSGYQHCLDHKGKEVVHGERFFPLGSDPCTQCTCLNGKPQMCIAVFCSPPENCRQYHALSDKCCEFVCLDRDFPGKANTTYSDSDALSTTNLGLRLVASTVTSFLILALLLFMIHRLRQRRLLLMIRRFHARRMDTGNAHLSRRFSEEGEDGGSVGYFVGHDQLDFSRYDEPPPPYTLWKPPEMYIPPGEAPPPYDLSVQLTAPYTSSFTYHPPPEEHGSIQTLNATQQQATISVHAVAEDVAPSVSNEAANPGTNCSICTAVDMELNNMANSTTGAVLPPDIQYEESCSYAASTSAAATTTMSTASSSIQPDITVADVSAEAEVVDSAVPSTSSCTCTLVSRKGKSKRHSCCEEIAEAGSSHAAYPSTSRDNNNLYPDPTAWCNDQCESSSSSSPTYEQPTLSPSTSDSSSVDADFRRSAGSRSFGTIPRDSSAFEGSRHRELPEEGSKAPHFQKTLSNLKKFSLIKRKKKKRRPERPSEISCSFVCQAVPDAVPHAAVFEDGIDLTAARDSMENVARPMEAINPHIGHKLASSGLRSHSRPTTISIPGQTYRQVSRRRGDGGPSFISYADVHCCGSVVTVSGGTLDCCSRNSPDQTRSLSRPGGISRSGSICSETGERRYHRSAGSSPTRFLETQYVSYSTSGLNTGLSMSSASNSRRTARTRGDSEDAARFRGLREERRRNNRDSEEEDEEVRHIPVWVVNSVALASRHEVAMRRSASGGMMGEGSRSTGDVSSPLDFRDSMLSSGSSWEACSHL